MSYFKKVLLFIISTSVCTSVFATTIVIYITPTFVIMAVDSKAVYTNAITNKKTTAVVSKIYKTGNVYFSIAGLASNRVRSFDVSKIANADLKSSTNITTAINKIKSDVKQALLTYLSNQKKTNYKSI